MIREDQPKFSAGIFRSAPAVSLGNRSSRGVRRILLSYSRDLDALSEIVCEFAMTVR
jgi:hypothetical protein